MGTGRGKPPPPTGTAGDTGAPPKGAKTGGSRQERKMVPLCQGVHRADWTRDTRPLPSGKENSVTTANGPARAKATGGASKPARHGYGG